MNEALILLVLVSITVNVIAVWKLSTVTTRITAQAVRARELTGKLQDQANRLDRLQEYAENIHFHHDVMSRSLRFHLHAAGLVYEPRLWHSYDAIIRAEWPFDQKTWPYHLPMLDNPASRMDKPEDLRAHDRWRKETGTETYHRHPRKVVDTHYIQDLDHVCAEYLQES